MSQNLEFLPNPHEHGSPKWLLLEQAIKHEVSAKDHRIAANSSNRLAEANEKLAMEFFAALSALEAAQ